MHLINKYTARQREFTFIELKREKISATFMDYGATILSIFTQDKEGVSESILLAYNNLHSYVENDMYVNATIGPFSGRIDNATFKIDDVEHRVDKNVKGQNINLHGGSETIAFKFFDYLVEECEDHDKLTFTYHKKDLASKFPGKQKYKIVYSLYDTELLIEFIAKTDEDTIVNLTNHAYFNLSGNLKRDILHHNVSINSSKTLELNEEAAPIGVKSSVGTFLDYRELQEVQSNFFDGIYDTSAKGIDHPFMLDDVGFEHKQVVLEDPISKRRMEVYTTYPCVVVYTHNYPDEKELLFGATHKQHMGICFEAQFEPNGMNVSGLNDSILRKDNKYYHKTLLKFSVKE